MHWRFSVLASGSLGNACLLQAGGFGVLIDAGIGPRILTQRLNTVGAQWTDIHAVLLTHTHADHWNDRAMNAIASRSTPLFCHSTHVNDLMPRSAAMAEWERVGAVNRYEIAEPFVVAPHIRVLPILLDHDSEFTFGFRIECQQNVYRRGMAIGYLADLGCWQISQLEAVADVDLLALEFNHDEQLLRRSRRPPQLIQRVLGNRGHLSNDQAAEFLANWFRCRRRSSTWNLVQLHLSRDCNRSELAQAAANGVIQEFDARGSIRTSNQFEVCSVFGET